MTDHDNKPYAPPVAQCAQAPDNRPVTPVDLLVRFFSPVVIALMGVGLLGYASYWMPNFIFGTLCIVVALGLLCWEVWAKYLLYAMASLIIAIWLSTSTYTIWSLSPPRETWTYWLISLTPGLLLVAVCGCGMATTRAAYAWHAARAVKV